MEAMATGVPVVATTVGAFPELVQPGVTGALVPPGDVEAMALAVGRLLDDEGARRHQGAAGRDRVRKHFTLAAEAEALNAVYRQLELTDASPSATATRPDDRRG